MPITTWPNAWGDDLPQREMPSRPGLIVITLNVQPGLYRMLRQIGAREGKPLGTLVRDAALKELARAYPKGVPTPEEDAAAGHVAPEIRRKGKQRKQP